MSSLNPQAPEFIPNQHHHHHHHQHQSLSWSIPPQHCYFILSSFFSSQLIHQLQLPLVSYFPFHDATNMCKQLNTPLLPLLSSEAEPTRSCYLSEIEPTLMLEAEVEKHQQEEAKEDGSKGNAKNRVKKRQIFRRAEKYFRTFPNKNRFCRTVPVRVDGEETTLMIKNIPNKYTRDMLLDFLDKQCMLWNRRVDDGCEVNGEDESVLAFDFVYLPIDFQSGLNKGYAFVNFTSPKGAWKFNLSASNRKWELFQSHKIREVVAARLQGKEELQKHFESMNFPCVSEEVLPVCFTPSRDGVIKGEQRTFGSLFNRQNKFEVAE